MKKGILAVVLSLAVMVLGGCASVDNLKPGVHSGYTVTMKGKTIAQVWDASLSAINAQHLEVVAQDKEAGTIRAQTGGGSMSAMFDYGQYVGIFIKPDGAGIYAIEVQQMNRSNIQVGSAKDYAKAIADSLRASL
jgi:uncharacterized protein YceK